MRGHSAAGHEKMLCRSPRHLAAGVIQANLGKAWSEQLQPIGARLLVVFDAAAGAGQDLVRIIVAVADEDQLVVLVIGTS